MLALPVRFDLNRLSLDIKCAFPHEKADSPEPMYSSIITLTVLLNICAESDCYSSTSTAEAALL